MLRKCAERGSEFKADFERMCQTRGLDLFVLPPKRPGLNGCVERAQGSWRYEFYASFDLPHRFNHHRPLQALGDKTPAEYLAAISTENSTSNIL
jgi:putative transposase